VRKWSGMGTPFYKISNGRSSARVEEKGLGVIGNASEDLHMGKVLASKS